MENVQTGILKLNRLSALRGLIVVSQTEGKLLGKVSHVFINSKEKKLSSIIAKDEFWSTERLNIPIIEIDSFGEDVIFIKSESNCKFTKNLKNIPGISLKTLQGHGVISKNGKHIGQFEDANFNPDTWVISDLYISGNKVLKVDASEIVIGENEIIVPSTYSSQIKNTTKKYSGILSRLFDEDEKESGMQEKKVHLQAGQISSVDKHEKRDSL